MLVFYLVAPTTQFTCGTNEYKCKDVLKCIDNTKTCDKNPDCPAGDDEVSCCKYLCLIAQYVNYFGLIKKELAHIPYLLVSAPRRSLNFQSFRCGAHSGAALFKKKLILNSVFEYK